jgi:hypothetical protein
VADRYLGIRFKGIELLGHVAKADISDGPARLSFSK